MTRQEISILIPVYNAVCVTLVNDLRQMAATASIRYEILVADDGSTAMQSVEANLVISNWEHCRYIRRTQNIGRAAIRNFLAREAQYQWLVFIDSHMAIENPEFLDCYLHTEADVVYGGYTVSGGNSSNLRYLYEKACEPQHRANERKKRPFLHFHTCNFMVRRDIMLSHPFDERFRKYGYEDVLFGKQLKQTGISVTHLENPVAFNAFESNVQFLRKTEEALQTAYEFRKELQGYSQILTFANGIHIGLVRTIIRICHRLFSPLERRNLCGNRPSLFIFRLYKLGYFMNI